jgi:hypothetical protein
MKTHFIILICIASTCDAQTNLSGKNNAESLKYYSEKCKQYLDYKREYLSDSVYIETHGDVSDTFMLTGSQLYNLHGSIRSNIIDVRDFDHKDGKYKYFYSNMSASDTLKKKGESAVQYKLRLYQHIVIYVPAKVTITLGIETYSYYILGNCYPVTETCIKSKIVNGQYGLIYFEKGIGYTGFSSANTTCIYRITDDSYIKLTRRKKT